MQVSIAELQKTASK